jgi:thymidylate kinase
MIAETTPAVHPALAGAAAALDRAQVRWALLRVPQRGVRNPRGDVDVLIEPDSAARAADALAARGFLRVPLGGPDLHLVHYAPDTGAWLWLHATTSLAFGPRRLASGDASGPLAQRHRDGELWRLSPDTEFWALLWHCLADKGHVPTEHRDALRGTAAAADCGGLPARALAAATGEPAISVRLLDAVTHDDWERVESHATDCQRAKMATTREPMRPRFSSAVRRRVARVMRPELRGVSVAVLGPDGAGKSTLVEGLAAAVPLPSTTIYMGLTGGALRHVRRLRVPGVVFAGSALVIWSRYVRAWVHMRRGRLVMFDRYVYDGAAPPGYAAGPLELLGRRLSTHLCPAPDLVLLLDAPGAIMYARKGEYDAATLERWRQRFLARCRRLRHVEVLDASLPAPVVRALAINAVWSACRRQWLAAGQVPVSAA